MAGVPFKRTKKFELNQPLKNSLKAFKELRASSSNRYDPYRKYDATIVKKSEKVDNIHSSYVSFITSNGIKVDINPKKASSLNTHTGKSTSSSSVSDKTPHSLPTTSTPIDLMSPEEVKEENELEFLPFPSLDNPKPILKYTPSLKQNVALSLSLKYECFQLNCNSTRNFLNFVNNIPTAESEEIVKNYESCLHSTQKYFNNDIRPIKTNVPSLPNLLYSPDLDCLPNYADMTDIEISLLQRMVCGCKSLTWDEFEKMYLIEEKSELNDLFIDDHEHSVTDDPLIPDTCCKVMNKGIILNPKFHRHKKTSANYSPNFTEKRSSSTKTNDTNKKHLNKEDDPLCLPESQSDEMVDSNAVNYVSINHDDSDIIEEATPSEILGVPKSTMELLVTRLNNLRATEESSMYNIVASHEESERERMSGATGVQSSASPSYTALAEPEGEMELQATTISEEEFASTADLRNFLKAKKYISKNISSLENSSAKNNNVNSSLVLEDGNSNRVGNSTLHRKRVISKSNLDSSGFVSSNDVRDSGIRITNVISLPDSNPSSQTSDDSQNDDIEIISESRFTVVTHSNKSSSKTSPKSSILIPPMYPKVSKHRFRKSTSKTFSGKASRTPSAEVPLISNSLAPSSPAQAPSIPIIQFVAHGSDSEDSLNPLSDSVPPSSVATVLPNSLGEPASFEYIISPLHNAQATNVPSPLYGSLNESAVPPIGSNSQRESATPSVLIQSQNQLTSSFVVSTSSSPLPASSSSNTITNSNISVLNIDEAQLVTPHQMGLQGKDDATAVFGDNVSFLSIPFKVRETTNNASTSGSSTPSDPQSSHILVPPPPSSSTNVIFNSVGRLSEFSSKGSPGHLSRCESLRMVRYPKPD